MSALPAVQSVLQLAAGNSAKSAHEAQLLGCQVRAAAGALQQAGSGCSADACAAHLRLLEMLTKQLSTQQVAKLHPILQALQDVLKHSPRDALLQVSTSIATELGNVIRLGNAAAIAASCACCHLLVVRLQQHVADSSHRATAAQALSKVVAATVPLLSQNAPASSTSEGFQLVIAMARCMPQVLKSQTQAIRGACIAAMSSEGNAAMPLAERLHAAHALACIAACAGNSQGWAEQMHGALHAAHAALAVLPMPQRDADLQRASQDVLGGAVSAPWHTLPALSPTSRLHHRVERFTLLLHCVSSMLSERAPMPAPLPMSALVLLASRLLALRASGKAALGGDPVEACQWAACCQPLLAAGAHFCCL